MCVSVCLSVREDISGNTCAIFTNFFVHVAYVHGLFGLQHVDDRPHHLSAERSDGSAYDCIVFSVYGFMQCVPSML